MPELRSLRHHTEVDDGQVHQHGLIIDPAVLKKYQDLDAAVHGLDRDTGIVECAVGASSYTGSLADATIANSVASRLQHLTHLYACESYAHAAAFVGD